MTGLGTARKELRLTTPQKAYHARPRQNLSRDPCKKLSDDPIEAERYYALAEALREHAETLGRGLISSSFGRNLGAHGEETVIEPVFGIFAVGGSPDPINKWNKAPRTAKSVKGEVVALEPPPCFKPKPRKNKAVVIDLMPEHAPPAAVLADAKALARAAWKAAKDAAPNQLVWQQFIEVLIERKGCSEAAKKAGLGDNKRGRAQFKVYIRGILRASERAAA